MVSTQVLAFWLIACERFDCFNVFTWRSILVRSDCLLHRLSQGQVWSTEQARSARWGWWERAQSASGEWWEEKREKGASHFAFCSFLLLLSPPLSLAQSLKYLHKVIARDWGWVRRSDIRGFVQINLDYVCNISALFDDSYAHLMKIYISSSS